MRALRITATTLAMAALTACGPMISGNGNIQEESRAVGSFYQVEVADGLNAEVWVGTSESVFVRADENLLPHIRTESTNGVLRVYSDENILSGSIRVRITVPLFTALTASGGAKVTAEGINANHFDLTASGGSEVKLVGRAADVRVVASGGSEIRAHEMYTHRLTIEASGGSTLEVHADDELNLDASGGSTVEASGRPARVSQNLSGGSRLTLE